MARRKVTELNASVKFYHTKSLTQTFRKFHFTVDQTPLFWTPWDHVLYVKCPGLLGVKMYVHMGTARLQGLVQGVY